MALSVIIDPGGIPGQIDGFNIQVIVTGTQPIVDNTEVPTITRTASQNLLTSTLGDIYNTNFEGWLDETEYQRLQALRRDRYIRSSRGENHEVVIYQLAEKFSEVAAAQSRLAVPSLPVDQVMYQADPLLYQWTYFAAYQGTLNYRSAQVGNKFICRFTFAEGTKLTP